MFSDVMLQSLGEQTETETSQSSLPLVSDNPKPDRLWNDIDLFNIQVTPIASSSSFHLLDSVSLHQSEEQDCSITKNSSKRLKPTFDTALQCFTPPYNAFLLSPCSLSGKLLKSPQERVGVHAQVNLIITERKFYQRWTELEKIVLVGLVFDVLFHRGSLFPNKSEGEEKGKCWKDIKRKYDIALKRIRIMKRDTTGDAKFQERPITALEKRFKILKRSALKESKDVSPPLFKKLYNEWETQYNVENILTCSEEKFVQHLNKQ